MRGVVARDPEMELKLINASYDAKYLAFQRERVE